MNFNTEQHTNLFHSRKAYLQFRSEWKSHHNMLASESRKAKLEIKAAGRLLNTAQIEQESRVPDKLYLDLKGLQHEKLHNARLTTLALDIIALTRNQKTRIAIASKDSAEYYFLLSGLGELVRLGIFSDFAAISEACKKGLSNATS